MENQKTYWVLAPVKVTTYTDGQELVLGSFGGVTSAAVKASIKSGLHFQSEEAAAAMLDQDHVSTRHDGEIVIETGMYEWADGSAHNKPDPDNA